MLKEIRGDGVLGSLLAPAPWDPAFPCNLGVGLGGGGVSSISLQRFPEPWFWPPRTGRVLDLSIFDFCYTSAVIFTKMLFLSVISQSEIGLQ